MIIPGNIKVQEKLLISAESRQLHSAYIFIGRKGIGKERLAISMAAKANGLQDKYSKVLESGALSYIHPIPKPNKNDSVSDYSGLSDKQVLEIKSLIEQKDKLQFTKIEPEGSNLIKIDQIRSTIKNLMKTSSNKHRFVVLPDAENMNLQTANAFLKTLEEPPESTTIILTTSEPKNILPTIKSRCQAVVFAPPSFQEMISFLEKSEIFNDLDHVAIESIAKNSDGSILKAVKELSEQGSDYSQYAIDFLRLTLRPHNYQIQLIDFIGKELKGLDKIRYSDFLFSLSKVLSKAKVLSNGINDEYISERDLETLKAIGNKFGDKIDEDILESIELGYSQLEVNVSKELIALGLSLKIREALL